MDRYIKQLKKDFENWGKVLSIKDFVLEISKSLSDHNFTADNSRLVFSVCSDDINRLFERETLENSLKEVYNGEFHLGSLGAYPIGGITGITAASHHVPDDIVDDERKEGNLIFFVSPHMGLWIENDVTYGKTLRPGQKKFTSSCGALMGFLNQLKQYKSAKDFKTPEIDASDLARMILYRELLNANSNALNEIIKQKNENQQVIALAKLNHDIILNKTKATIDIFLKKNHFEGRIVIISGVTVNAPKFDLIVLKDVYYYNME